MHYTEIKFKNYKAFKSFRAQLNDFNVLVGPNNAGKSTILGAFRILSEGIRKAASKKPEIVEGPNGPTSGYRIQLDGLPVSTENVFHNYNDDEPAQVIFTLSNKNKLNLFFPARGSCNLILETQGKAVRSPAAFHKEYKVKISTVPVLGPVEHNENLYQKEAARKALLAHTASRNFRNIWHHYPDDFEKFKKLIQETWPGMDIEKPEVDYFADKPRLHMFCPEERYPREIFWAGFGFQVWCQMLTFIIQAEESALLIIDEPDIYLHADLQRQLVGILKDLGPDIIIATHSTEIISEVSPECLLSIDKSKQRSKRINNVSLLNNVFQTLGSNLNPTLTQLAKTKKVVLVEGKDFKVFSKFARLLGIYDVANRSNLAVVPVEGFNPERAKNFIEGVSATLGGDVCSGIIFDRDYRSEVEVKEQCGKLAKFAKYSKIHDCKEIENFLLVDAVIERAVQKRISDIEKRTGKTIVFEERVADLFDEISSAMRAYVFGQYLDKREKFEKSVRKGEDPSVFKAEILEEFDSRWNDVNERMRLIPGKEFLTRLNDYFQLKYKFSLTPSGILDCFRKSDVPDEMKEIITALQKL